MSPRVVLVDRRQCLGQGRLSLSKKASTFLDNGKK
jgi:hypothetical protein